LRMHRLPAETDGVFELLAEMAGVDEQFFRHAAPDHAGAAEAVFLGDGDARARGGRHARRAHTARSGADDEKIEIVFHAPSLPPPRGEVDISSAARNVGWGGTGKRLSPTRRASRAGLPTRGRQIYERSMIFTPPSPPRISVEHRRKNNP